ncbi:hypothetical protein FACS1894151_05490 [Spirochaetia bacterium]|nr:hypothetical protein FACS1894151_05490 [Spirochaetia bacterium]
MSSQSASYLYETHLHTAESSDCGVSPARDYIRRYINRGYTGIIVTDHFFRGNTAVDRRLPWKEWVHRFCRGFEEAHNEGERRGLDVFFGWEETYEGDDFLIYGLDKTWLLEHPEVRYWTRKEQLAAVHEYGGCVVQAHPFREAYYLYKIILNPFFVDAVEAANGGNHQSAYDAIAMRYAQKFGLPVTAGSDIHDADQVQTGPLFGVYLDKKLDKVEGNSRSYAEAVRSRSITGLCTAPGRCDYHGDEYISLPVTVLGADEKASRVNWRDYID